MNVYLITATATWKHGPVSRMRQIPTFVLDGNIQGITSTEGAEKIARRIIDPFELGFDVSITALPVH